jgi:hypothetical protein
MGFGGVHVDALRAVVTGAHATVTPGRDLGRAQKPYERPISVERLFSSVSSAGVLS